ncbi:Nuclear transport factor 2 [Exophiala dermatitidis]|nr:Nuclear transport factor 2 [Exophiala dermatitidis]KAJ4548306.1 Nuclear transport factor 2 [Exophiala dermatitidis]KAJ4670556.1 Nuclear transport factor 2 [Exophiala dermatitidis]KAJ4692520.1 Nuclear transport factor 2 [Exophiala dermatitidis]
MADFQTIAQQFVEFYYKTFDTDRAQLAALYVCTTPARCGKIAAQRNNSMLTFEKDPFQGTQSILEKLTNLPFQKVQHRVDTTDAQPSNETGGILVMVTGALMVDDQPQPMSYVQVFNLLPDAGSYYVQNDVFRLVYAAG